MSGSRERTPLLSRRSFVASLPLAVAGLRSRAWAAEPLTIWGPPATPSVIAAQAIASGALASISPSVSFKTWKSPDEMRAGLSSGTMTAVIVPTYAAANLYNRGLAVHLVNVLTDGLLYVVAPGGTVARVADLKGRRVAVPFRNDMPDYIFRRMLADASLTADDMTIDYSGTPIEAVQMLLAGRVDAALLSEPAASVAIVRASLSLKTFERAIDCQTALAVSTGRPVIPQAGLAVTDVFVRRYGEPAIAAVQSAFEQAVQAVTRDPSAAASATAAMLELPRPMIERSIPFSKLVARAASAARSDLVALFDVLARQDPRIIGGRQPDDRFYAI
ncbi:MAG: ABC transporter substrate-binding protein [Pseudorhodoplanes sp.]|nr:ABC transporter substrate-binding protein [Pseudorhodoplanes sp.]